jgi:hypothetical protein
MFCRFGFDDGESTRRGDGLIERGVDAAVPAHEIREGEHVGRDELRNFAVFDDPSNEGTSVSSSRTSAEVPQPVFVRLGL